MKIKHEKIYYETHLLWSARNINMNIKKKYNSSFRKKKKTEHHNIISSAKTNDYIL